ncbi:glutamate acetyltransferase [Nostoc sp. CENA67]|uniref:Glutamate acetyltransferase n=1 Tax=Amazonocrinis nigriterrae CENA67 TaxID=2794033 RepID=A0A8J7HPI1_9NOST|nr:DALR anticodon-binding domain-containing protein [Amazonocrinis nigriterrae]MBH8561288.1 glutamate acetyltransferase [Amazonocrinis nigriterrae CENA67]
MDDRTSGKNHKELFIYNYVQLSTLVSKDTALKQLLYRLLTNALSIYTSKDKIPFTEYKKLHLSKGRYKDRVLYISGMALWLSKSHNRNPMEIASAIVSHFLGIGGDVFTIEIVPPGWIYLELTDTLLAAWLQSLAVGSLEEVGEMREMREIERKEILITNSKCKVLNTERLFKIQYVYARCCSLLRLAHREGLIKLREPLLDVSSAFGSVIFTEQIPWLDCDQKLRLNHPNESCLITKLVQVVDDLMSPDLSRSFDWEKAGMNLSQAFENFWSKCRIWGEVKICSPELAQARLGLVMVTQSVLRFLLVEKLGVVALQEL